MVLFVALLTACTGSSPPSRTGKDSHDTAVAVDSADSADSGAPCDSVPAEGRASDFGAIMGRLASQGCLDDADIALAQQIAEGFHQGVFPVWCDGVYRVSSEDGRVFAGEPELVQPNASVPDAMIDQEGRHVVVYNDLGLDVFADVLQNDPARFWREGLVGIGGVGMRVAGADGWEDAAMDLHLSEPTLVVDPDLARRFDGDYRLVTFSVSAAALDGVQWDPYQTPKPHAFMRAVGEKPAEFSTPSVAVSSLVGLYGGADPTVLDDGSDEVLYAGDYSAPMAGWTAPGGVYPAGDAAPDVRSELPAAAPDVVADVAPDGTIAWRLYYFDTVQQVLSLATSTDGRVWLPQGAITAETGWAEPSVVRDADGGWWLYFAQRDPVCEAEYASPQAR